MISLRKFLLVMNFLMLKFLAKTINQEPEKYFTEDIMTKLEEVAKN